MLLLFYPRKSYQPPPLRLGTLAKVSTQTDTWLQKYETFCIQQRKSTKSLEVTDILIALPYDLVVWELNHFFSSFSLCIEKNFL